ncbi:MAG: glycoside hydrolase family 3 N-terminal domain-containing protein, partial [Bacilli bacterium]|nr:glycoside hydrolase family 3 N-terminal domain-containing protein [Bacilli bacterium]
GQYKTPGLASVGKVQATDQDGPASLNGGYTFASATNIASTWNIKLAYERGRATGNYSLFRETSGWYAPSMNTHRSPFSGRNFEYYSQDGFLAGTIAAQDVKGFQDKGGYAFIKHFAVNDQESDRMGTGTFATEQAIRENHMKAFEVSVKEGGAKAVMSSFNRIGAIPASGNYVSINGILRGEWGFHGEIVTDFYMGPLAKGEMAIRAGAEMPLGNNNWGGIGGVWDATLREGKGGVRYGNAVENVQPESPTQYFAVRNAALHILWVGANSNNNRNLTDSSVFENKVVDAKQYVSIGNQNVSIDTKKFGTDKVSYSVSGNLPAGVIFNPSTATFSGAPSVPGTYRVTVNVLADYWMKNSFTVTFNVAPGLSFDTERKLNIDESIDLNTVVVTMPRNGSSSGLTGIEWIIGELPDGITWDEVNKQFVGETTATDYRLSVTLRQTYTTMTKGGRNWWTGETTPDTITYTTRDYYAEIVVGKPAPVEVQRNVDSFYIDGSGNLVVTYDDGSSETLGAVRGNDGARGGEGYDGEDGATIVSIEKTGTSGNVDTYTITLSDGRTFTFTITNGVDGEDGHDGADGQDGANGKDGKDGKDGADGKAGADGKGGCGGSIAIASVGAALAAASFAAILAKKRKKED